MRLDAYLVDMGYFKSRGRAKTAIVAGNVKVNGTAVTKVSRDVSTEDVIEVAEGLDQPQGYFKLKHVQEESGILKPGDIVLDLGSSAGGFLLFASEIAGHVKGIEFSRDFRSELGKIAHERENVEVTFGDVFTVPLNLLSEEPVDVILSDMTLEPEDSVKALSRVLPLLKTGGKLLQVIKIPKRKNPKPILSKIENLGLEIQQVVSSEKQEIYVVARKPLPEEEKEKPPEEKESRGSKTDD
ncbi:methyltransferase domain-containing protein [Methanosarcina sp. MSH10X1]|uniref:S4 domain-containing protein n=1 Tax=Methanosarcina sp. MSH10X1 TaxID=2507075 RepID=UPI000FFBE993|nr:S4 domain-containing protein [Methanosarcina sp. MSH10X1]RXA21989.1 methyltransferase domain-containing protein [Methanosarcina sp. MSH10X1]